LAFFDQTASQRQKAFLKTLFQAVLLALLMSTPFCDFTKIQAAVAMRLDGLFSGRQDGLS
jgi:hypothetical protein